MGIVRSDSHYFVYEWFRPDNGDCFYVGKGSGRRAKSYHSRNYVFKRIIAELSEKQLTPTVRIYKTDLTNKEALRIERERRAYWAARFINLSNVTGIYRTNLKRMRRLKNRPKPEVIARVRRIFG